MTVPKNELAALSLVKQIKQCYEMTYAKVDESLDWAIRCGEFLSAAKSYLGHGAFGGFIEQHFDFSQRRAQSFMKLYKDLHQIPKASRCSLLKSAGSIASLQNLLPRSSTDTSAGAPGHGAQKSHLASPPVGGSCDADPSADDSGEDGRTESDGTEPEETSPTTPRNGKASRGGSPPKKLDRKAYYKQWDNAIGPIVRLIDKIGHGVGEHNAPRQRQVERCLHDATAAMMKWMEVEK